MSDLTVDTVADLPDDAETLLLRVDLNSPIEDGRAQDNARFRRHAETVEQLSGAGYRVVVMAHQGRPGRDSFVGLESHAAVLESHLTSAPETGTEPTVAFVDDVYGDSATDAIAALEAGEILLLQNVRFTDAELAEKTPAEHAETDFVRRLSDVADAYVNDAYSVAHRPHASIVGFPRVLPSVAGPVMAEEYEYNASIRSMSFDGEVTMVLGGTKAADLIPVMAALEERVDTFVLGGVVGELFLRAAGHDVGYDVSGSDRYDDQWAEHGDRIQALTERYGKALHLPLDLACEDAAGERAEVDVEGVEKDRPYLDVGSRTVEAYEPIIERSAAVFVKGALGVFEDERFAEGTRGILEAIADSECYAVVGGGDTARAIDMYDIDRDGFDHVSIAGGAYARALTGEALPGITALQDAAGKA